jgi:hypothetical protein
MREFRKMETMASGGWLSPRGVEAVNTVKRVTTIVVIVLLLAAVGWQQYQIHQVKLDVAKARRTAEFAIGAN